MHNTNVEEEESKENQKVEHFAMPSFDEQEKMTVAELTQLLLKIERYEDSLKRYIRSKFFN